MAFGTYSDLQTQVANWLGRSDLSANIPDFITLFEAWVNRRLNIRQQDTTIQMTTSSGVVALPTDYLSWRRLSWLGPPITDLWYTEPSAFRLLHPDQAAGVPAHFSIEGSNILTADWDDTTNALEFEYFQKTQALQSTLNFLYTTHPDAYLFGTLTEAYGYQKDPDNMAIWGNRRDKVFDEIDALDARTRAPSMIVVAGPTP